MQQKSSLPDDPYWTVLYKNIARTLEALEYMHRKLSMPLVVLLDPIIQKQKNISMNSRRKMDITFSMILRLCTRDLSRESICYS